MPAIEQETGDVRHAVAMTIELQRIGKFYSDDDRQQPCADGANCERNRSTPCP